ncbi:probable xyloglucan endotransglucosylase/hydrolase protein 32 isoform X1 [Juglans microcarpa x Juglans regia]|uniref:probable xyloglucan endotransglucosylase/hydrolase protein 32 isoform X1 n=1 Tax=Juglans microcarpa x Juglans regia TaxID=2249226 RepID=UPI001B7E93E6|nr:probable xyloglucan endotransglucosylase/hydrolase protein 32 isoform X1 [Juglans microcarpa x Juglans regia]
MQSHSSFLFMAPLLYLILCFMSSSSSAQGPPSPGYSPSSKIDSINFDQGFRNLWGPQHQRADQGSITLWLDSYSGSGFKSLHAYRSGYFGADIKLQSGYTAGVITSFYLSNNEDHPGNHDEIDIEFLGTTPDKPYTLQTNVYVRGSGDGNIVGREIKFHLWFDPTQDYHRYAILWNPSEIIFLVDDVPIRRYPRKSDATFPSRPMYLYGSIWDASSWATEDGKYKADYQYQPFIGRYTNFKIGGCTAEGAASCNPASASPSSSGGLSQQQYSALEWVQRNYLVYNYCQDAKRDHTLTPEC